MAKRLKAALRRKSTIVELWDCNGKLEHSERFLGDLPEVFIWGHARWTRYEGSKYMFTATPPRQSAVTNWGDYNQLQAVE